MPSPAGASAAAAAAAIAASVVVMAAEGSPDWGEGGAVAEQARAARVRLVELADEDVRAFDSVLTAGREAGRAGLPAALEGAARVPLEIGDRALAVATLASEAVAHAKRAVRPDAAAAEMLATRAAEIGLSVVEVNLGHPAFPPACADELRAAVAALRGGVAGRARH